jgi:hypothetical protein
MGTSPLGGQYWPATLEGACSVSAADDRKKTIFNGHDGARPSRVWMKTSPLGGQHWTATLEGACSVSAADDRKKTIFNGHGGARPSMALDGNKDLFATSELLILNFFSEFLLSLRSCLVKAHEEWRKPSVISITKFSGGMTVVCGN